MRSVKNLQIRRPGVDQLGSFGYYYYMGVSLDACFLIGSIPMKSVFQRQQEYLKTLPMGERTTLQNESNTGLINTLLITCLFGAFIYYVVVCCGVTIASF